MGLLQWWRRRRWHKQRLIYRYWDGKEIRSADPFRIYRELYSDKTVDINTAAPAVDQWQEPETTQVIDLLCKVFKVSRFNPETKTGLIDAEIVGLLYDVSDYLDSVKKKYSPGPTSPPATA